MPKRIVNPPELADPRGFNHGLLVSGGDVLYLAGQDASGPDGEIVAVGNLVGQFDQVMRNVTTVVKEAGGAGEDIVKLNVFVDDVDRYRAKLEELGTVFRGYMGTYPAMALFEVSGFFKEDAMIEVEGFAVIEDAERA